MNPLTHRAKSAEENMATLYSTKFCNYRRPVKNVRVLSRKLSTHELPKWARPKPAWKRKDKFTFTELDGIGAISKAVGGKTGDKMSSRFSHRENPLGRNTSSGDMFSGSPAQPWTPSGVPVAPGVPSPGVPPTVPGAP